MSSPPARVHLPSGRLLRIEALPGLSARRRRPGASLFSELVDLVTSGDLTLHEGAARVEVPSLELRDFHALRAIATRLGWLHEEAVDFDCDNCGAPLSHRPCAALELGPFVDGELDDPELDRTLDLGSPWPIVPVELGGGRVAEEVTLVTRTAAAAAPLHRALRRRRLAVTDRLVVAMGVSALGPERDVRRIAGALARASDASWARIGDLFLAAHYPPRLASMVLCPRCGARNDVDAPYEREFEPAPDDLSADRDLGASIAGAPSNALGAALSFGTAHGLAHARLGFPGFEAFAAQAQAEWERTPAARGGVTFIVDDGVPACDGGGAPLLGSYVPPAGEPSAPIGLGEITVYYRTFEASWRKDGPFDWREELRETVEHEGEHHAAWLRGSDPTDDEERAEIVREEVRWVGRRSAMRSSVAALGAEVRGFIAHTWPLWLIVAAATLAISVCGK